MSNDFLDKILTSKKAEITVALEGCDIDRLKEHASGNVGRGFGLALSDGGKVNIIAEYKKASPSKGDIATDRDVIDQARAYQAGGAVAMSILTEVNFFKGCIADMVTARRVIDLPILRKDFTIDEYQIIESAAFGCDAILLIVRILSDDQLADYIALAHKYKMDALVEIFDEADLARALKAGARIIGINNRDLATFALDNDNAVRLSRQIGNDCIVVAASGVNSKEDVIRARSQGLNNFLIGETLMRSSDPAGYLRQLASGSGLPKIKYLKQDD